MSRGIFIKQNGVWVEVINPQIKTNNSWTRIRKGFVKKDGTWQQFYPPTGSVTYSYSGVLSTFTVPAGIFEINVVAAGAGGGGGGTDSPYGGSAGSPGRYISGQLAVNPGDILTIGVGGGGQHGNSGSGYGGGASGINSFSPFSTLDLMGNPDNLRVTNGAYVEFLNTYGIWNYTSEYPSFNQSVSINFPYAGYYNVNGSVDNAGQVYIDGAQVLSMPGEFGYRSVFSNQIFLSAGNHTVVISGQNWGGPGSIGVTIDGGFNGGRGGNPGPSGWSGGGGGGGAATTILLNGRIAAVAGGGGGGGGGGNQSPGRGTYYPSYGSAGQTVGGNGQDKGGDGAGGGGGGGGYQGGLGAPTYGGDDGAYVGESGGSWPTSGFVISDNPAGGGGAPAQQGGYAGTAGANGYATISW
jgi:hypothetical protein